jgi:hypothetical protein
MLDVDTFLTTLYVMVDDFCKEHLPPEPVKTGPNPSLTRSEVVTLSIFAQFWKFKGERDFYRYAERHLRGAFRNLPHRSQFNRLVRSHWQVTVASCKHLVDLSNASTTSFEILDTAGVPVRNVKRRGSGWLAGFADIGWSTRLGWFNGFRVILAVNPIGFITGFAFGAASAKDQPLADSFLSLRRFPNPAVPSVGKPALGPYVLDTGFVGAKNHHRWLVHYGAEVVCKPRNDGLNAWPKSLRRWFAGIRQIVETVYDKLVNWFRLGQDRPHEMSGFHAGLAAKIALHNFCIWLNLQLGRSPLEFADLVAW